MPPKRNPRPHSSSGEDTPPPRTASAATAAASGNPGNQNQAPLDPSPVYNIRDREEARQAMDGVGSPIRNDNAAFTEGNASPKRARRPFADKFLKNMLELQDDDKSNAKQQAKATGLIDGRKIEQAVQASKYCGVIQPQNTEFNIFFVKPAGNNKYELVCESNKSGFAATPNITIGSVTLAAQSAEALKSSRAALSCLKAGQPLDTQLLRWSHTRMAYDCRPESTDFKFVKSLDGVAAVSYSSKDFTPVSTAQGFIPMGAPFFQVATNGTVTSTTIAEAPSAGDFVIDAWGPSSIFVMENKKTQDVFTGSEPLITLPAGYFGVSAEPFVFYVDANDPFELNPQNGKPIEWASPTGTGKIRVRFACPVRQPVASAATGQPLALTAWIDSASKELIVANKIVAFKADSYVFVAVPAFGDKPWSCPTIAAKVDLRSYAPLEPLSEQQVRNLEDRDQELPRGAGESSAGSLIDEE